MENIKFSFIIPTYNSKDFIEDCLNSIFSQSYKNYEVIVIDDCSTDNTLDILKQYNIKVFSTPKNSRQGVARNIGLENCTGDYILFVDSDDSLYANDVVEKIAKAIEKNNFPDIIYLGLKMFGNRDLTLIPNEENSRKEYRLAENPFINVLSICWKNEMIQKNHIRFPEYIRYEDVYFAFLGIEKSKTYSYTNFIYYNYNSRPSSTTTLHSLDQSIDTIKLIDKLFELYDIINNENVPYLNKRIQQQASRATVRLDRAIDKKINEKNRFNTVK